ncbi:MAG: ABC transporter permease [Candidatus Falkowbacteria bacterium]
MLIRDIFRLSTRMFRTNRSRTILTILGISVGIGTILFLVSLGYGLQRTILSQITTSEALLSLDVGTGDLTSLKLDNEAVDNIREISGVEKISPQVSVPAQMSASNLSSEIVANFVDNSFFRFEGVTLKDGDFYSDSDEDKNKIVVSTVILKLFNLTEEDYHNKKAKFTLFLSNGNKNENGEEEKDSISLEQEFEIIGIIDEDSASLVYLPFSISQDLGIDNYSKIKIKVDKKDDLDVVRTAVIEKGYLVSALSDIIEQANQVFKIVQIVLALFGIVALMVSAIGMFNTMTIALLERTQEIGIMKALGATGRDIWNMFLGESVIIGFTGGLGGIIIGFIGGELFNIGINILARTLGGEAIDLFYTPFWFMLLIIFFSTFVGLATGFYPASRAAKINCLEALRYK